MNTLKELLELAIQAEVNAQKLYQRGADIVEDKKTRQFMERLVKEEQEHEKMLFNILDNALYDPQTKIDNAELFEAARNAHGSDSVAFDDSWTIDDILEVALKREFNARKRYEAAAASVADEELKTLFLNLASDETNHHKVIDRQYRMFRGQMGEEI